MIVKKEYPIGTKVRFTAKPYYPSDVQMGSGKCGAIVGQWGRFIKILLPDTVNSTSGDYTWIVPINDLTILPIKGEQLEFDFMKE